MTCKACEDAAKICEGLPTDPSDPYAPYWMRAAREIRSSCRHVDAEAVREACARVCVDWSASHKQDDGRKVSNKPYLTAELLAEKIRALDLSKINAAPQSSTAEAPTAPSPEGVGQGEIAGAAPYAELVKRLRQAAWPDPSDEREVLHAPLLYEAAAAIAKLAKGEK